MGWADDMHEHSLTNSLGGVLKEHDDEWGFGGLTVDVEDLNDDDIQDLDTRTESAEMYTIEVIRNCNLTYQCPLRWDSFEETSNKNVRFCTSCRRTVHYCYTPEQLRKALLEDHCVAFRVTPECPQSDSYEIIGF